MSSLLQQAKDLKEAGSASGERIDCDWAAESERAGSMSATPGPKPADVDVWISNPLRLWLEDAIVGHISAYSNKVTWFGQSGRVFRIGSRPTGCG